MPDISGWLAGGLAALALPFVYGWVKAKLPHLVVTYVDKQLRAVLAGHGVGDYRVAKLKRKIILALVEFAEEELPDEGLGEARMNLILDMAGKIPFLGKWMAQKPENRALVRGLVEEAVKEMDADLKKLEADQPASEPPAAPAA